MADRRATAYEAAVMHYVHGDTMDTIARRLGTSRSTVSRLIAEARDQGMVTFSLNPPRELVTSLGARLERRWGIAVHVVPVPFGANEARRLSAVSSIAGIVLGDLVTPGMVLGVAWGNTVSVVADHLVKKPAAGSVVVQLNGAANPSTTGIPYAGAIMEAFGEAHGSSVQHFPVPAFFDFSSTREAMWRERSISVVRDIQARVDLAIFGVGAMAGANPSQVYSGGYFTPSELAELEAEGVVGDVCTVLLRADGSWEDLAMNQRATGPTPVELRRIPRRVCVVSGTEKVAPLLAALLAETVTDLVIDEDSAALLLEASGEAPDDGADQPS